MTIDSIKSEQTDCETPADMSFVCTLKFTIESNSNRKYTVSNEYELLKYNKIMFFWIVNENETANNNPIKIYFLSVRSVSWVYNLYIQNEKF